MKCRGNRDMLQVHNSRSRVKERDSHNKVKENRLCLLGANFNLFDSSGKIAAELFFLNWVVKG